MIGQTPGYSPHIYESEAERASSAYLMSIMVLLVGLPLPIINLIASVMFYVGNRKKTYFVRFHCMQSMLSQLFIIAMNIFGLRWTLLIIFGDTLLSNAYIAYMVTIIFFNILEIVASLYAAVQVRKKIDVRFWFFGPLTEMLCNPTDPETPQKLYFR